MIEKLNNYINRSGGFRGKLSKKFERSVHTSALVIN